MGTCWRAAVPHRGTLVALAAQVRWGGESCPRCGCCLSAPVLLQASDAHPGSECQWCDCQGQLCWGRSQAGEAAQAAAEPERQEAQAGGGPGSMHCRGQRCEGDRVAGRRAPGT